MSTMTSAVFMKFAYLANAACDPTTIALLPYRTSPLHHSRIQFKNRQLRMGMCLSDCTLNELLRAGRLRMREYLVRDPSLDDFAQIHEDHVIGQAFGLPQGVGHQHDGILLLQFMELALDVL